VSQGELKSVGRIGKLPSLNSKFAPENGWLEDDSFLFWDGFLAGVSFRGCKSQQK